jgi:glycosyltransferase involved in cell wall biosynthesis
MQSLARDEQIDSLLPLARRDGNSSACLDAAITLSRLRVCLIAGTLGQGGAERQLFYIARALKQSGADVHILSLTRGEFWEDRIRELGVLVRWVGQNGSKISRLARIISSLRERPVDICQSQHFYTNLYSYLAARVLRIRSIGAIRNDAKTEARANGAVLGRFSLRAPRLIAANSNRAIQNAIDLGVPAARLHLLPNVIDCDQFDVPSRPSGRRVRLLMVGRLVQQKRVDRFLRLLHGLRLRHSNFEGVVVGDGPLRNHLERQAQDLGLVAHVKFAGIVTDMAGVYRDADVLVLTSDFEGTPNVVLEAMASGLPVLSTDVGGVSEILTHGKNGYVHAVADEASLLASLVKLVADESLRLGLGQCGLAEVKAHHSAQHLPVYLEQLYRATLS